MTTNWKEALQVEVMEDYLTTASNKYLYDLDNGKFEEDMRQHWKKLIDLITNLLEKQRDEYVEMIEKLKKIERWTENTMPIVYTENIKYNNAINDVLTIIKSHDKTS